jgi:hypothetical protein
MKGAQSAHVLYGITVRIALTISSLKHLGLNDVFSKLHYTRMGCINLLCRRESSSDVVDIPSEWDLRLSE